MEMIKHLYLSCIALLQLAAVKGIFVRGTCPAAEQCLPPWFLPSSWIFIRAPRPLRDNKQGRAAECAAEGGGANPEDGGGQTTRLHGNKSCLPHRGRLCGDGRQEGSSASFCRFCLERHESEFIEKDRYPTKAAKAFQDVDGQRDYNPKVSAAMGVRRNSEVNEPSLTSDSKKVKVLTQTSVKFVSRRKSCKVRSNVAQIHTWPYLVIGVFNGETGSNTRLGFFVQLSLWMEKKRIQAVTLDCWSVRAAQRTLFTFPLVVWTFRGEFDKNPHETKL